MKRLTRIEGSVYNEKVKIIEVIQGLKEDHPVLDEIINNSLGFLPPPFNGIAKAIYDSFNGSKREKIDEVLNFINEISKQNKEYYEYLTSRLTEVTAELSDINNRTTYIMFLYLLSHCYH